MAQPNTQYGFAPTINFNKKLSENEKLNFNISSRELGFDEGEFSLQHAQTEFSLVSSTKLSLHGTLALGYSYTDRRTGGNSHNLIQQFTISNIFGSFRLGHRIATDQAFGGNRDTRFRLRYRLSCQLPLSGQSVNRNEFYIKVNNEYLNQIQESNYNLQIRLASHLGFEFNDNNKVELGIEYRAGSLVREQAQHLTLLRLIWFVSL